MKKYTLVESSKRFNNEKLYRIKALSSFRNVKKGDIGGFVSDETCLAQSGNCWIYDNATVCDGASVCDNATIKENALIFSNAQIYGNATVSGYAVVSHNSKIFGDANVYDNSIITKGACIMDNAIICGDSKIEKATIKKNVRLNSWLIWDSAIIDGTIDYEEDWDRFFKCKMFPSSTVKESFLNIKNFKKIRKIINIPLRELNYITGISYEKLLDYSNTGKADFDVDVLNSFLKKYLKPYKSYDTISDFILDIPNILKEKKFFYTSRTNINFYAKRVLDINYVDRIMQNTSAYYMASNLLCDIKETQSVYPMDETIYFRDIEEFKYCIPELLHIREIKQEDIFSKIDFTELKNINLLTYNTNLPDDLALKIAEHLNVGIHSTESENHFAGQKLHYKYVNDMWLNLSSVLNKRHTTQYALAEKLNISPSILSKYRTGARQISYSTLLNMMNILNAQIDEVDYYLQRQNELDSAKEKYEKSVKKLKHDMQADLSKYEWFLTLDRFKKHNQELNEKLQYLKKDYEMQKQLLENTNFDTAVSLGYDKANRRSIYNMILESPNTKNIFDKHDKYNAYEQYIYTTLDFAYNLADLMEKNKVSQRELVSMAKVNRYTIDKLAKKEFDSKISKNLKEKIIAIANCMGYIVADYYN